MSGDGISRVDAAGTKALHVLALTRYGPRAASTRQRFLQYQKPFAEAGIELTISPFLGDEHVASLEHGGRPSFAYYVAAYLRRLRRLLSIGHYDLVWVHFELFPYLPGWVEALASSIGNRPIVFDFDDAIFHNYDDSSSAAIRFFLKGKLEPVLRRASAVTCGNQYLQNYAIRFCERSEIFPTVVDTDIFRPAHRDNVQPTIGWIGSPSNWDNVRALLPVIKQICTTHGARFRAIGAGIGAERDRFSGMELAPWSDESEVAEIQAFDIGIMPLLDTPFHRGKSGYKLIQYMACGVPAIGSPVGVNAEILANGRGLIARTAQEWKDSLERLLEDAELRRQLALAGRREAIAKYSLAKQAPRLIALLRDIARSSVRKTVPVPVQELQPAPAIHIVHVISGLGLGGAEAQLYRLVTTGAAVHHEVVCLGPRDWYSERLEQQGVRVEHLNVTGLGTAAVGLTRLYRMLKERKPDVVQTWLYSSNLLGGLAAKLAGFPVIWSIRCESPEPYRGRVRLLGKAGGKLAGTIPDLVVSCSARAAELHAAFGYAAAARDVIPNGYDPTIFYPDDAAASQTRRNLQIPDDVFLIGSITRWIDYKDVPTLLRALRMAADRGVKLKCVLMGNQLNEQNAALMAAIHENGCDGLVLPLGRRADVPALARAFDLHVLSSTTEAFPNVVAETMLSGTPNVATDVGDAALIAGNTGWIVPPRDPKRLAEAIEQAWNEWSKDRVAWQARRTAARKRISEEFTFERATEHYTEIWQRLAGNRALKAG